MKHGTGGYEKGCRCEPCTAVHRDRCWQLVIRTQELTRATGIVPNHGLNGYKYYGCRCETCTKANTMATHARRKQAKAATA